MVLVEVPTGHAVQAAAPVEIANEPTAQAVQPDALAVPLPVIMPAKPGAHRSQAPTDTLAAAAVVTPSGQAVQVASPKAANVPFAHGEQPPPALGAKPAMQAEQAAMDVLPFCRAVVVKP